MKSQRQYLKYISLDLRVIALHCLEQSFLIAYDEIILKMVMDSKLRHLLNFLGFYAKASISEFHILFHSVLPAYMIPFVIVVLCLLQFC
jgi:hypothetical protein